MTLVTPVHLIIHASDYPLLDSREVYNIWPHLLPTEMLRILLQLSLCRP